MSTATITARSVETNEAPDRLTKTLEQKLSHPATSRDFDLHAATNEVLKDIGLTTADAGCKLTFSGPSGRSWSRVAQANPNGFRTDNDRAHK